MGEHTVTRRRDIGDALLAWIAVGCLLFTATAIVFEIVASTAANSAAPAWVTLVVPLAWPQLLRVAWWLAVAGAALGFHISMRRLGFGQPRPIVFFSVAPFVTFALGIAAGADWATWH